MNPSLNPIWSALEQVTKGQQSIYQQVQQNRLDENLHAQQRNITNLALNLTSHGPALYHQDVCDLHIYQQQSNPDYLNHNTFSDPRHISCINRLHSSINELNNRLQDSSVTKFPAPLPKKQPIHIQQAQHLPDSFILTELNEVQSLVCVRICVTYFLICLFQHSFISVFIYFSIYLFQYLFTSVFIYFSIYLFQHLFISAFIYFSIYLFRHLYILFT